MTTKSRAWCWTWNNPEASADKWLQTETRSGAIYACWEHEVAPSTGTPHIQGYWYFQNPRSLAGVKKLIYGAHFEIAKGSPEQNRAYCSKEAGVEHFERGTLPQQGKRSDIQTIKEMIKKGATMPEIIEVATSYQAIKGAELIMKYQSDTERDPPTVHWFYGPTGTGKTRTAVELSRPDMWISSRNLKWWDGYWGQKNVILDDFRRDFCDFAELLRILDRYPIRVETKGSSVQLRATTIFITSPYRPEEVYQGQTKEKMDQLLRRITEIRHFPGTDVLEQKSGVILAPTSVLPEVVCDRRAPLRRGGPGTL